VKILVTFEHGEVALLVTVDPAGRLLGLQLAPADAARPIEPWRAPDYVDPARIEERDVMIGEAELAVRGALTVPRQAGSWPAVVLLAGSGALGRDETIGRNKPFKDIAWGLAARGVAVLRFDKVTHAHPELVRANRKFTATDEYVPHALAAVRLLRAEPGVDTDRIFVAGHSLGGTIAPRVAAADPAVAGLIILAGGWEPLHRAALRQVGYLASLNPEGAVAGRAAFEALARQADAVDDPNLSESTPDSMLPFGTPAAYWLDLRGYDPAVAAAGLGKPILVVQGGRDYQSTVADDLAGWRAGLAGRPDVTVHVHDRANHLFFTGDGPSSPAEYEPAQHVDPAVIADIAEWVLARQSWPRR